MNQTQEQKKAAFIKAAAENQSNYLLHKELIEKKIKIDLPEFKASVEHFYKTGNATDYFLLALIDYAESYHEARISVSGSLPSKDEAVNVGFRKATVEGYNYRRVCKEPDHDIYYSGWMDCYDWLSDNDR